MKKIIFSLVLLAVATSAHAVNYDQYYYQRHLSNVLAGNVTDPIFLFMQEMVGLVGGVRGTGNIWYVDSNVTSEGNGKSWVQAKDTLNEAIALCTDNNGDVIFIAQGHTETLGSSADQVDADSPGITIIGCGTGELMAKFDYTGTTTGTFAIGADNVTIYNCRFHANVTDVSEAIEVEAGSTDWHIIGCIFDCETEGTDEFHECITSHGAASDKGVVAYCDFRMGAGGARSGVSFRDVDYMLITGNVFAGDYAIADVNNATTASNHILINENVIFNGTIGGNAGLNTEPCIELLATTTGVIANNTLVCNVATPDVAIVGADMYLIGNTYSEAEATSVAPMWLTTDTTDNVIGFNDADNAAVTSSVASDRDGSILERLEFICKYFETGSPAALVAPASARTLLDILGTDGTTTTGALAGSILGAIGTNEVSANTPFTSSAVEADSDGSALERLEQIDVDTSAIVLVTADLAGISQIGDKVVADMDANSTIATLLGDLAGISQIGDKVVADMDANSLLVNWTAARAAILSDLAGISQIGDKVVADMDANSILADLAGISQVGDKVVADFDANSTTAAIVADLAGISQVGDKVVADMDANSLLVNWTAVRAAILSDLAGISEMGDKVVADMDANSILADLAGISQVGDKVVADFDANSTTAAIVADLAGISQVGDKVQADMDANSTMLYWQERAASVTADEITQDLWDVAGGPILITSITGIVTVQIGAAVTTAQLIIDRDDAAADTEFTTAVSIEGDVLGTVYVFTAVNPAVLTPLTPGASGSTNLMDSWFCPEGMIEQLMSADPGGAVGDHITWYMTYIPLTTGITVTAQ